MAVIQGFSRKTKKQKQNTKVKKRTIHGILQIKSLVFPELM